MGEKMFEKNFQNGVYIWEIFFFLFCVAGEKEIENKILRKYDLKKLWQT